MDKIKNLKKRHEKTTKDIFNKFEEAKQLRLNEESLNSKVEDLTKLNLELEFKIKDVNKKINTIEFAKKQQQSEFDSEKKQKIISLEDKIRRQKFALDIALNENIVLQEELKDVTMNSLEEKRKYSTLEKLYNEHLAMYENENKKFEQTNEIYKKYLEGKKMLDKKLDSMMNGMHTISNMHQQLIISHSVKDEMISLLNIKISHMTDKIKEQCNEYCDLLRKSKAEQCNNAETGFASKINLMKKDLDMEKFSHTKTMTLLVNMNKSNSEQDFLLLKWKEKCKELEENVRNCVDEIILLKTQLSREESSKSESLELSNEKVMNLETVLDELKCKQASMITNNELTVKELEARICDQEQSRLLILNENKDLKICFDAMRKQIEIKEKIVKEITNELELLKVEFENLKLKNLNTSDDIKIGRDIPILLVDKLGEKQLPEDKLIEKQTSEDKLKEKQLSEDKFDEKPSPGFKFMEKPPTGNEYISLKKDSHVVSEFYKEYDQHQILNTKSNVIEYSSPIHFKNRSDSIGGKYSMESNDNSISNLINHNNLNNCQDLMIPETQILDVQLSVTESNFAITTNEDNVNHDIHQNMYDCVIEKTKPNEISDELGGDTIDTNLHGNVKIVNSNDILPLISSPVNLFSTGCNDNLQNISCLNTSQKECVDKYYLTEKQLMNNHEINNSYNNRIVSNIFEKPDIDFLHKVILENNSNYIKKKFDHQIVGSNNIDSCHELSGSQYLTKDVVTELKINEIDAVVTLQEGVDNNKTTCIFSTDKNQKINIDKNCTILENFKDNNDINDNVNIDGEININFRETNLKKSNICENKSEIYINLNKENIEQNIMNNLSNENIDNNGAVIYYCDYRNDGNCGNVNVDEINIHNSDDISIKSNILTEDMYLDLTKENVQPEQNSINMANSPTFNNIHSNNYITNNINTAEMVLYNFKKANNYVNVCEVNASVCNQNNKLMTDNTTIIDSLNNIKTKYNTEIKSSNNLENNIMSKFKDAHNITETKWAQIKASKSLQKNTSPSICTNKLIESYSKTLSLISKTDKSLKYQAKEGDYSVECKEKNIQYIDNSNISSANKDFHPPLESNIVSDNLTSAIDVESIIYCDLLPKQGQSMYTTSMNTTKYSQYIQPVCHNKIYNYCINNAGSMSEKVNNEKLIELEVGFEVDECTEAMNKIIPTELRSPPAMTQKYFLYKENSNLNNPNCSKTNATEEQRNRVFSLSRDDPCPSISQPTEYTRQNIMRQNMTTKINCNYATYNQQIGNKDNAKGKLEDRRLDDFTSQNIENLGGIRYNSNFKRQNMFANINYDLTLFEQHFVVKENNENETDNCLVDLALINDKNNIGNFGDSIIIRQNVAEKRNYHTLFDQHVISRVNENMEKDHSLADLNNENINNYNLKKIKYGD